MLVFVVVANYKDAFNIKRWILIRSFINADMLVDGKGAFGFAKRHNRST